MKALFENLVEQVNGNQALVHRGRYVDALMMVGIHDGPGSERWSVSILGGRIASCHLAVDTPRTDDLPGNAFLLNAPRDEWQKFWLPLPPPGSHDLFALLKRRVLTLHGNLHPFMANMMYFKAVLAMPRQFSASQSTGTGTGTS